MSATVRLSPHARLRRKQMGVTEHQIEGVLADPELVYPADPVDHPPGRTCHQRGPLVVVTEADGEVVTILYHRASGRDEHGGPLP